MFLPIFIRFYLFFFFLFWPISTYFDQFWPIFTHFETFGPFWTCFDLFLTLLDPFWLILTNVNLLWKGLTCFDLFSPIFTSFQHFYLFSLLFTLFFKLFSPVFTPFHLFSPVFIGISDTIYTWQDIQCLPSARFFLFFHKISFKIYVLQNNMKQTKLIFILPIFNPIWCPIVPNVLTGVQYVKTKKGIGKTTKMLL